MIQKDSLHKMKLILLKGQEESPTKLDSREPMKMKIMLYGRTFYPLQHWIRTDADVNAEETHRFNTSTQFQVIYGVEDLLNISDHEQDRHRSSESDNGAKHIVRDFSNSCKETEIKRESTKQTQISV